MLALVPAALAVLLTTAPAPGPHRTRNVAIVLYDGVEILDFAGPTEVFAAAAGFGRIGPTEAFRVYTVAASTAPLRSQGVVTVVPEFTLENAPRPDLIVIPGGNGGPLFNSPPFKAWLARNARDAELVLTVCTGAFAVAATGMLDGLEATTWYDAVPRLAAAAPKVKVVPGRRFVDTGKVITTAGVSAGIDGSLHVVARLLGRYVADQTARYMEYHWTPEPFLAKDYALWTPGLDARGRKAQQAEVAFTERRYAEAAAALRELASTSKDGSGSWWYRAGYAHSGQGDLAGAAEAFTRAAAFDDTRAGALYDLACIQARTGEKARALESLRRSVEAGLKNPQIARTDEDLASVRDDPRFEEALRARPAPKS